MAYQSSVDDLFTSVSNGKELVASAITDMGVATESDATFQDMAENIRDIPSMQNINGDLVYGKVTGSAIESGDFVYASRAFGNAINVFSTTVQSETMILRTLKNNRGILVRTTNGANIQAALIKLDPISGSYDIGNYITVHTGYVGLGNYDNQFVIVRDDGNTTICCGVAYDGTSYNTAEFVYTIIINGDNITSSKLNTHSYKDDDAQNPHYIYKLSEYCIMTSVKRNDYFNQYTWNFVSINDAGVASLISYNDNPTFNPESVFQIDYTHARVGIGGSNVSALITLNAKIPTSATYINSNVSIGSIYDCTVELRPGKIFAFNVEFFNFLYFTVTSTDVQYKAVDFSTIFPSSSDIFSGYSYYNAGFVTVLDKDTYAEIYLSIAASTNEMISMVIKYDYETEEFSSLVEPVVRSGTNIGNIYNIPQYNPNGLAINHNVFYHPLQKAQIRNDLGYNITVSKPSGTVNAIAIGSGSANQTINFIVEPSLW